jgi:hypothetical protein
VNLDDLDWDRPELDCELQQVRGIPRNLQLDETVSVGGGSVLVVRQNGVATGGAVNVAQPPGYSWRFMEGDSAGLPGWMAGGSIRGVPLGWCAAAVRQLLLAGPQLS